MRRPRPQLLALSPVAPAPGPTGRQSALSTCSWPSTRRGDGRRSLSRSRLGHGGGGSVDSPLRASRPLDRRWTVDRCGMAVLRGEVRPGAGRPRMSMQRGCCRETVAAPERSLPALARSTSGEPTYPEAAGRCRSRSRQTEVLAPVEGPGRGRQPIAGRWVGLGARRCGTSVAYMIRFTTTPKGTTFIAELQR